MSSKKTLQTLHEQLATVLLTAVTEGVPMRDEKTGEVTTGVAPAAILNVARQFLKDNQIEAIPVEGSTLANLALNLPFAAPADPSGNRH
jgi:hypothetical protein